MDFVRYLNNFKKSAKRHLEYIFTKCWILCTRIKLLSSLIVYTAGIGENDMSLNAVTLVGRAGGDPDVKYFESGSVVCNLTLAVNRMSRNNDQPDWFNLELWGKQAEVAANYVRKGSLIGVSGSLKFEYWKDRNTGADRSKPVIRVERLELLGSKRDSEMDMGNSGYQDEF